MPRFVIERKIRRRRQAEPAGAPGHLPEVVRCAERRWARASSRVHSYVTDDCIYCVYIAPTAEMVREHAQRGGFPADSVSEVRSVIDPTTSEG